MCTTRMQTGVGRPQFSAVLECATEAKNTVKQFGQMVVCAIQEM